MAYDQDRKVAATGNTTGWPCGETICIDAGDTRTSARKPARPSDLGRSRATRSTMVKARG